MFNAVFELVMGLFLLGSVAIPLIAGFNAYTFGAGGPAILGMVGTIGLLLIVFGFIQQMRKGGSKAMA
jgi:hypothetical protein